MTAATLVAAALRLFRLGEQNLWIDELLSWESARVGARLAAGDLFENVHGPLYSLLLHAWCGVAGDSEWALRLPSAVLGAALVPALAWLAARWLGSAAAIPAAWLAACSPFLVWYSQEARNYALLLLCAVLAGGALLSLRTGVTPGRVGAYAATAAGGMLANFSFALLAPIHLRWWLAPGRDRGRRIAALAAVIAVLTLLAAPWIPHAAGIWDWRRLEPGRAPVEEEVPLRAGSTFHPVAIPFALHAFAVGYSLGPPLRELRAGAPGRVLARHVPEVVAVAVVFGVLGALGLRALVRRRRAGEFLLWAVVPVLVVSYFALQNFKVFTPRYLAVAFPACLLLLAAAIADLPRRGRWVAGGAVGVLWLLSLHHHYFDPRYAKEDHRAAAALVLARGVEGERLLAVNAEEPMRYYYRGPLPQDRLWLGFAGRPARLEQKLDEALGRAPGTWVVLSRPENLDPADEFARTLDRRYPDAGRYRFSGVRVWHIRRS